LYKFNGSSSAKWMHLAKLFGNRNPADCHHARTCGSNRQKNEGLTDGRRAKNDHRSERMTNTSPVLIDGGLIEVLAGQHRDHIVRSCWKNRPTSDRESDAERAAICVSTGCLTTPLKFLRPTAFAFWNCPAAL
jgi:hypothetical protein